MDLQQIYRQNRSVKRNKAIKKDLEKIINQQEDDPDAHVSGNVRTYTDADYKLMAEAIFEAMNGMGTNGDSILTILNSLRTKADWYALNDAFGIRKTTSMWSSFEGNLTKWLADELDSFLEKDTKAQVNNILAKFGVGRI